MIIMILPTGIALADIGPKPTMEFRFSYTGGQELSAVGGALMECEDLECLDSATLKEHRTSTLTCESDLCYGTLFFGGSPAYRLQVSFSDNQTRLSNPFTISMTRNVYDVKVEGTILPVRKNYLLSNNTSDGLMLCIIPFSAAGILLLFGGLLTSDLLIQGKNRGTELPFKAARGNYLLTWGLSALALAGGMLLSWSLPITILIELGVAYLYYRYSWPAPGKVFERNGDTVVTHHHDRENRPAWLPLMTSVIVVNLITQPLLWAIASGLSGGMVSAISWPIALLEVAVWVIEAILLKITQWRKLNLGDAFLLSLLMNLASFLFGLIFIL